MRGNDETPATPASANVRLRYQGRDPSHSTRRVSIPVRDEQERAELKAKFDGLRRDVRTRVMKPSDASAAVRRVQGRVMTVADLWERYSAAKHVGTWAKQAKANFTHHVEPHIGNRAAWEMDDARVLSWVHALDEKGLAPNTVKNVYNVLAAAFRLAVARGWIDSMPWDSRKLRVHPDAKRYVESRSREAIVSWDEAERLILAASIDDADKARRGFFADSAYRIAVMLLCGLRQGEAAALGWDRVQIDGGGTPLARVDFSVRDQWKSAHEDWDRPRDLPKNQKRRTIALAAGAVEALKLQRENLKRNGLYDPAGPVFPRVRKVRASSRDLWRTHAECIRIDVLRRIVEAAGIPNPDRFVAHSLRHGFVTLELVASGGDFKSVMARTGHSSVKVMQDYAHALSRAPHVPSFTPALSAGVLRPPTAVAPPAPSAEQVEGDVDDEPSPLLAASRLCGAVAETGRHATEALAEAEARREARRARRNARRRPGDGADFTAITRAWIAAGRPGERPEAVTAWADRKREAVFKKAMREPGMTREIAQRRAGKAKGACLANFAKVLARIERGAP